MIPDEYGLRINRLAISPNGLRVAVQFEGFAHYTVLRGDRATDDPGDTTTACQRATEDQLTGWIRVSPGWTGGKVTDATLYHEPVEPGIEPIDARPFRSEGAAALRTPPEPAIAAESPMAPDTVTLPLNQGPALVYLDADGADRLDAGPLLESGPGGFGERVASPRRLALIGALLTLAGKRLTRKASELDGK